MKGSDMIEELEKAVMSIGQDIFEQTGEVEYFNITVESDGSCQQVKFIGIYLWNSDNDMRKYVDENEEIYEPIEDFLRRELMNELKKLQKINV
jgi:hypothetical protein